MHSMDVATAGENNGVATQGAIVHSFIAGVCMCNEHAAGVVSFNAVICCEEVLICWEKKFAGGRAFGTSTWVQGIHQGFAGNVHTVNAYNPPHPPITHPAHVSPPQHTPCLINSNLLPALLKMSSSHTWSSVSTFLSPTHTPHPWRPPLPPTPPPRGHTHTSCTHQQNSNPHLHQTAAQHPQREGHPVEQLADLSRGHPAPSHFGGTHRRPHAAGAAAAGGQGPGARTG